MPTHPATLVSAPNGGSVVRRLVRGRSWFACVRDWPAFAGPGWQQTIMAEEVGDRFHAKQGRSIGRWTLTSDTGASLVVYLKRHYVLPRWCGLLATLIPYRAWSPGRQEWDHLERAKSAGVPVPRAVAGGEWLRPWGRLQSFLAVEELTGMLPLHEAIPLAVQQLTVEEFARWKRGLLVEMGRLSVLLHRRRLYHKDLYLCHFYIDSSDTTRVPASWSGRIVMIDFHRLGWHPLLWPWYTVKDLGQLLYSSAVTGVTARDRLRFWKAYRGGSWDGATRPPTWLRLGILWKWRLYDRQRVRRAARRERRG